jgi:hypothetical protein
MKTTKRLLLASALFLLAGYGILTTMRVRELETRLHRLELAQRTAPPIRYAFDESFLRYFGQEGIAAVERAVSRGVSDPSEILRELRQEQPGLRYEVK